MMRNIRLGYCIAWLGVIAAACENRSIPDVTHIPVEFSIQRFERDLFRIDTQQFSRSLDQLNEQYPYFLPHYIGKVLGLDPKTDSLAFRENMIRFLHEYKPIYDSCNAVFNNTIALEKQLKDGLQRVHYYFPQYSLPTSLITFIGPMDAIFTASLSSYGDILTEHSLGCGLQLHLGAGFSFYHSPMGQALYPDYITRRFTPEMIPVNAMKNIIDDIYPEKNDLNVLLDQMVEKGKRLYILDLLMPKTADTLKIGYTSAQWDGCLANEGKIWNFFVTSNLLMSNSPDAFQRFLNEGPQTPELGNGSPGYIGLFIGRQIVYAYMEKQSGVTPEQLLKTPARRIYEGSKYRPK